MTGHPNKVAEIETKLSAQICVRNLLLNTWRAVLLKAEVLTGQKLCTHSQAVLCDDQLILQVRTESLEKLATCAASTKDNYKRKEMETLRSLLPSRSAVEQKVQEHPAASALTALLAAGAAVKLYRACAARSALDRKRAAKRKSREDAMRALRDKVDDAEVFSFSMKFGIVHLTRKVAPWSSR